PEHILTWNRFFDLRRKRRFLNLGASCFTSLTTIGISAPIIATSDIDKVFASVVGVPVDPFIPLGVTALAVGAIGWMVGPSIGNAGFNLWAQRKGWKAGIGEKEKSFFDRIKRYRADPAGSSIQNPVPDYYGEKIKSVSDYRRWLKDQRVFARKVSKNML
ncbi:mitochondrial import protein Pam17, partial [Polychaeton citri CBS 116435]